MRPYAGLADGDFQSELIAEGLDVVAQRSQRVGVAATLLDRETYLRDSTKVKDGKHSNC